MISKAKKFFGLEEQNVQVTYYPGFSSVEELTDQYFRLLWYLNPLSKIIGKVYIGVAQGLEKQLDSKAVPEYLDPRIRKFRRKFRRKIVYFNFEDKERWKLILENTDIILRWNADKQNIVPSLESAEELIQKKKAWNVDRRKGPYEGSFYLKCSDEANPNRVKDLNESKNRFGELLDKFGGSSKAYVFGTGPSLKYAFEQDYSDGLVIASNSMVKNRPLLEHLKPKIVVFVDPIFHAGCSSYAAKFRQHLMDTIDEYQVSLVVPFRDYLLYCKNLPNKYSNKIIGVPLEHLDSPNFDLGKDFVVKSSRNVLTLMLLPLAFSLSREVGIIGCDGKKTDENSYFWGHHKESQINEEMNNIQVCHPSFFNISYKDYYDEHCHTLELWLSTAESLGKKVKSLTPSFIPALRNRSSGFADRDPE